MSSRRIRPEDLSAAIRQELTEWQADVKERVNDAGSKAMKKLVKLTRATAPVDSGRFRRAITSTEKTNAVGTKTYIWGAKAPSHRVTHLIVNGHAKRGGGRTAGDPFLDRALETILPEYEKAVKEAVEK